MNFHIVTNALTNFCINDLGGFYLDIIKDRQYTTKADSQARRSAQTALYHFVQAFVRWMSPILSFTAQEAWPLIPEQTGNMYLLLNGMTFQLHQQQTYCLKQIGKH
jgi:isoleucyl-tRNA synthetase